MLFFEWLKEWSPVLSLIAMIAIAYLIARIDSRQRAVNRRRRELNEIIHWAEEAIGIIDDFNQKPNAEKAMKVHSKIIRLTPQLKLFTSKETDLVLKPLIDTIKNEYSGFLGLLKDIINKKRKGQISREELLGTLYELQRKASDLKMQL